MLITYTVKKILIVTDVKPFIEKKKNILSRADFKIFTATSGKEALEVHRAENVDLIITDLDMPVINGDALCSEIRKDEKLRSVSIIIVCNNNKAEIKRCIDCNANLYITRPVKPAELLGKAIQLLNINERESYRVLLKAKVKGKYQEESFFCYSENISVSGILIETDKRLSKGDIIKCSFFLPGSRNMELGGEVVRDVRGSGNAFCYGIRFLDIDSDSKTAIEDFIKGRSKKK